jgi:UDP-2,3-diacylglucosamine hydrolase
MVRWRKLGILAGGGALPERIAASCEARATAFHIIRINGSAGSSLETRPGDDCAIGEIGKILRLLKGEHCDAVVFAGTVERPNFTALKVDWRGAALMPKIIAAAATGDGALLGVLVDTVEAEGFLVIGADEAVQGLEAPAGAIGAHHPDDNDFRDMRKAAAVINALGPFDVGQAAIVANGLVVAIEAAEGTDGMLQRCAELSDDIKGGARAGILLKRPKPGQELRVDLPVIGPETIHKADNAGLRGVAVEAGFALIIDRDDVIKCADSAGLFVYGFSDADMRKP